MSKKSQTKSTMNSDSWCSPRIVADPLEQFFGGPVGTDPCSNPHSIIRACRAFHAAGLHLPWTRREDPTTAYRNNPYSNTDPWITKAIVELNKRELPLTEEVSLVMVATSTKWWRRQCGVLPVLIARDGKAPLELRPKRPIRLLFTGRLKFIGDKDSGARFDTVLGYWGSRTAAFDREFRSLTKWSAWGDGRR